jgi:16S rRNA A1518/A1519 N6-dimethyltransferase RsmA/KsgA/DIM1 with predicted DNA glycosylase/AP lyase activity
MFEDIISVRGLNVLEIGVGASTKILIDRGANSVTVIDIDFDRLREWSHEIRGAFLFMETRLIYPFEKKPSMWLFFILFSMR